MRTTHTICLRRRRGISTILGTLIFIGVLFTAVIPMFLVMKQADDIYTRNVHEMEIKDDERTRENVIASAYPGGQDQTMMVKVENKGSVPVTIIRVWTNDDNFATNEGIPSNSYKTLGPFPVQVETGDTVFTKVVTERGNVFYSISGGLFYSGQWVTVSRGICVVIYNPKGGQFRIFITPPGGDPIYVSQCQEWADVIATVPVDNNGSYTIEVQQKKGNTWKDLPSTPLVVPIDYPNTTPPFIMVWVSP